MIKHLANPQTATRIDDMTIMDALVTALATVPGVVSASLEYPGFVAAFMSDGAVYGIGTANETWGADYYAPGEWDNGGPLGGFTTDILSTSRNEKLVILAVIDALSTDYARYAQEPR